MNIKGLISNPVLPGPFRVRLGARKPGSMNVKRLIYSAVLMVPLLYFRHGDENRLVNYLEGQGYSDVQIEHPNQWHCYKSHTFSYRARSPSGIPVHGGACVTLFFFIETTEPIGKN